MQREFPTSPLIGVGAIVIDQCRVLLVRRAQEPMKGRWSIPGGLIELGESLRDGVIREVQEETGLLVEPIELIELLDRIDQEGSRVRYHYVIADFLCCVKSGSFAAGSDAAEACWALRADLGSDSPLQLDPVTLRVLEKAWQRAEILSGKDLE